MDLRSRRVMECLLTVADAAPDLATYEQGALSELQHLVGFDVGFFVRPQGPGPGAYGLSQNVVEQTRFRWSNYGREMRAVVEVAAREPAGLCTDVDVLGNQLGRTQRFQEFMRPQGGRCTLVAPLRLRGHSTTVLALGRGSLNFKPAERDLLTPLLPLLRLCEAARPGPPSPLLSALSAREAEILSYLQLGYSNREIASALGTSSNTVRNQMRAVFSKLGASTRAEAVALSLGHLPH